MTARSERKSLIGDLPRIPSAKLLDTFQRVEIGDSKEFISNRCVEWFTIGTLIYVNLVNYVDRYSVSAVLEDLVKDFKVTKDKAGLLQTGFLLSYMTVGPLFGYLGDRYNRKFIIATGVLIWNLGTLLCSFIEDYWSFFAIRVIVGVGESGFSTIAPTIISDVFKGERRSRMLAAFYIAMPFGCGLGYIAGSEMAKAGESWHWGLRLSPGFGIVGAAMILLLVEIPVKEHIKRNPKIEPPPWTEDVTYIMKNQSFVYATIATTCVFFVIGALSWWGPVFIHAGLKLQSDISKTVLESSTFIFGITTIASGILGLAIGCYLSQTLRRKYPKADPFICSIGLLLSTPFIVAALFTTTYNTVIFFTALFFGELFLNFNCSVVNDILLYVTIPSRRSATEGLYLLITHAFGDAGSPYLIGLISETIQRSLNKISKSEWNEYKALQYSMFLLCIINVIGAFFFFIVSLYLLKDKELVDTSIEEI